VFAEFIDLCKDKNVDAKIMATLDLFAYGTYPDYLKNKAKYIELNAA